MGNARLPAGQELEPNSLLKAGTRHWTYVPSASNKSLLGQIEARNKRLLPQ